VQILLYKTNRINKIARKRDLQFLEAQTRPNAEKD